MRVNRAEVYRSRIGNPFLILGTSKIGITVAYIKFGSYWDNLPETKIGDLGHVSIEGASFKTNNWLHDQYAEYYDTLDMQQYTAICHYIGDYHLGLLVYDYAKEMWTYTPTSAVSVAHPSLVVRDYRPKPAQENDQPTGNLKVEVVESAKAYDAEPEAEPEPEEDSDSGRIFLGFLTDAEPIPEDEEPEEEDSGSERVFLGVLTDAEPIPEDEEPEEETETMYDLLENRVPANPEPSNRPHVDRVSISVDRSDPVCKRLFTYDEVKMIANMRINAISIKYSVTYPTAKIMCANAKAIINQEVRLHTPPTHDFYSWFKKGYDIDQTMKATGAKYKDVCYAYNRYIGSIMVTPDGNINARKKWDKMAKEMDPKDIMELIESTSAANLAANEGCSYDCMIDIIRTTKQAIIYKNPFALVGFGDDVFIPERMEKRVQKMRDSNHSSDKCNLALYEKILVVKEAYEKSYDIHIDIYSGSTPVPSYVPTGYEPFFKRLIARRFEATCDPFKDLATAKSVVKMSPIEGMLTYALNHKDILYARSYARKVIAKARRAAQGLPEEEEDNVLEP